jgi:hypothetical protein
MQPWFARRKPQPHLPRRTRRLRLFANGALLQPSPSLALRACGRQSPLNSAAEGVGFDSGFLGGV